MDRSQKVLAGSHTEAISPVAISPSNKAIYHLWDIVLLQYERSCTNESVFFISDRYIAFLLGDIATGNTASMGKPAYRVRTGVER